MARGEIISPARLKWAKAINEAWQETVAAIIETGRRLTEAKSKLEHGEFLAMVRNDLMFGEDTAQRLMAISRHRRLVKTATWRYLPPYWRTLYEMQRLPDDVLGEAIDNGTINPETTLPQVRLIVNRLKRKARFGDLAAEDLPAEKAHILYADPPWKHEVWAESAEYGAAAEHYPLMSIEELCALDIGACATDDAMLFMWVTVPMRYEAKPVFEAWGFDYKTAMVWDKVVDGMGYYVRNQHEDLIICAKGNPLTPEPADKPSSLIQSRRTEHSVKPRDVYRIINRMYPNLRKREFFARHWEPGWLKPWGNMAPLQEAAE